MKRLLVLVLAFTMTLVGCNTSWVNEALAILKVALPAALNVLQLVAAFTGAPVDQNKVQVITGDINNATKLLSDYAAAAESAKAGVLSQLDAALLTTQADLATILGSLHVNDAKSQAQVTALVDFVIAEVASIESLLPTQATTVTHAKAGRPPLTARQFKKGYNRLMPDPSLVIK